MATFRLTATAEEHIGDIVESIADVDADDLRMEELTQ